MKSIDLLCVATWHTFDLVNVNYEIAWSTISHHMA
jgi:hypothetical protein